MTKFTSFFILLLLLVPCTYAAVGIHNITFNFLTNETAMVSWNTTVAANGTLYYSTNINSINLSSSNSSQVFMRGVVISSLTPYTNYFYQLLSCGNTTNGCSTPNQTAAIKYNFTTLQNDLLQYSETNRSITATSVYLTWGTTISARELVWYNGTASIFNQTKTTSTLSGPTHSVFITGLAANTLYRYNITSCNATSGGTCVSSGFLTFTTTTTYSGNTSTINVTNSTVIGCNGGTMTNGGGGNLINGGTNVSVTGCILSGVNGTLSFAGTGNNISGNTFNLTTVAGVVPSIIVNKSTLSNNTFLTNTQIVGNNNTLSLPTIIGANLTLNGTGNVVTNGNIQNSTVNIVASQLSNNSLNGVSLVGNNNSLVQNTLANSNLSLNGTGNDINNATLTNATITLANSNNTLDYITFNNGGIYTPTTDISNTLTMRGTTSAVEMTGFLNWTNISQSIITTPTVVAVNNSQNLTGVIAMQPNSTTAYTLVYSPNFTTNVSLMIPCTTQCNDIRVIGSYVVFNVSNFSSYAWIPVIPGAATEGYQGEKDIAWYVLGMPIRMLAEAAWAFPLIIIFTIFISMSKLGFLPKW